MSKGIKEIISHAQASGKAASLLKVGK